MSRETWVAVAIFVSGVVGVALYWFYPDRVVEPYIPAGWREIYYVPKIIGLTRRVLIPASY